MNDLEREQPHILVGVTSPQTCLVLSDRLEAFAAAGFRVSLLSAPGSLADQAIEAKPVRAYTVPMGRRMSPLADFVALVRICVLLKRLKPDIYAVNEDGDKGGSEGGVLNLSYLLQSKAGEWYVVTGTWNDPNAPLKESEFEGMMQRAIELVQ